MSNIAVSLVGIISAKFITYIRVKDLFIRISKLGYVITYYIDPSSEPL